jgi:cholesterol transport system auxiliary component
MKSFLLAGSLLTLTGCSLIPNPGEPPKKFVLESLPQAQGIKMRSTQLVVDPPSIYPPLDNQRIALKPTPQRIDYFADVEWADRLGNLIQDSIIYSLQNTSPFKATSRNAEGISPDYLIKTDIRQFLVEQNGEAGKAIVEYYIQLIRVSDREVTSTKAIKTEYKVPSLEIKNIIHGLNQAHIKALEQIVHFVSEHS